LHVTKNLSTPSSEIGRKKTEILKEKGTQTREKAEAKEDKLEF